jgi:shikimate kinase
MMGAGKTTVGQKLAQKLGYRFLDLDSLIEKVTGKKIKDIFAQDGEATFREIETQVLAETSSYTRTVVATGGGVVLKPNNWGLIRHGLIIWLDVSPELLLLRLSHDRTRPLLQVDNPRLAIENILKQRLALYQQADLTIQQTKEQSPEEIVEEILRTIPSVLKSTRNDSAELN